MKDAFAFLLAATQKKPLKVVGFLTTSTFFRDGERWGLPRGTSVNPRVAVRTTFKGPPVKRKYFVQGTNINPASFSFFFVARFFEAVPL